MSDENEELKVISAEGKILGRLASRIASMAKEGKTVRVVKSEDAVISGDEQKVLNDYKTKKDRGARDRGPYFPKRPDRILKRTVKGMLPSNPSGRDALDNVRTYLDVPEEFEDYEEVDVKEGDDLLNRNYVKLGRVSKHIGWKGKRGVNQ